jgi:glycerate dehydrogenase
MAGTWKIHNPSGEKRILVTRNLPGTEWLTILKTEGYRVEVWIGDESQSTDMISDAIGVKCSAVIGQLTEKWDAVMFDKLAKAGGIAYSNYAVGFDNVDIEAATRNRIAVGNTPGVLTEATAEMAVALTMACARRITESDKFTRNGSFKGWLPDLFLGKLLWKGTLGIIGTGRIGSAFAKMMIKAFQMNLVYFDNRKNATMESEIELYNQYLIKCGSDPVKAVFAGKIEDVLKKSDVLSLHVPLTGNTRHLIAKPQLQLMKPDAILVNTSRGAVINEADLAEHCRQNPDFSAGLDVYEFEPAINDGLMKLPNVTLAPHIASGTVWSRENMSKLAALNVKGVIEKYPLWEKGAIDPFLGDYTPEAIPSILNGAVLTGM